MSLDETVNRDSLRVVNHADMKNMLEKFFEKLWGYEREMVISDRDAIFEYIEHITQQIRMISHLEG